MLGKRQHAGRRAEAEVPALRLETARGKLGSFFPHDCEAAYLARAGGPPATVPVPSRGGTGGFHVEVSPMSATTSPSRSTRATLVLAVVAVVLSGGCASR